MLDEIKKKLFLERVKLLTLNGLVTGQIVPFDEEFYERLSHTYICGLPISFHIKYLAPVLGQLGNCYDRSLYMFLALEESILVRADRKDLKLKFGEGYAGHGWVEIEEYVYDPTTQARYNKTLYYKIFEPTHIMRCTREEYCKIEHNKEFLTDVCMTTIEDFLPKGRKHSDLIIIPLVKAVTQMQDKTEFLEKLDEYLKQIEFDEKTFLHVEIGPELHKHMK